ncbi:MAG: hypothetical protein CVT64_01705 [Actinobacteria bacterium HGW-Actinobacteria-4]|nr:MAG: hypothetical protein CVT64_01705 [Actinobacteria bacterium HGW-Actinobacteria-4]
MAEHKVLTVAAYGMTVASVARDSRGQLVWTYDTDFSDHPLSFPASLSLPLTSRMHRGDTVANFLDSLLPDHQGTRARWAQDARVEPSNIVGLLAHFGRDVAGALEFSDPARPSEGSAHMREMREADIEARIIALHSDDWWGLDTTAPHGRFSLPGAQGKLSLLRRDGRWWETQGAVASSHIFKHGVPRYQDSHVVEHVSMRVAALLGVPTAHTELATFGNQQAIVIERFDRVTDTSGTLVRLHQEDLNQATGTPGWRKYEDKGGLSYRHVLNTLDRLPDIEDSRQAMSQFARGLAMSWLLLDTDAHARNYSVQITPGGAVTLAPRYDVSSFLPYVSSSDSHFRGIKLAMQIVGDFDAVSMDHTAWRTVARDAKLDPDDFIEWITAAAAALSATTALVVDSLEPAYVGEVSSLLLERAELWQQECLRLLEA